MKRHPALIPLSRQHHDALALCVFIDRGLKKEPTVEKARQLREQAVETYELLIRGHFEVEEAVLFPMVRRRLPKSDALNELMAERPPLRHAFENLANRRGADLIAALRQLGVALERHVRKEERELFPLIQQKLDESSLASLGEKIRTAIRQVCLTAARRR